MGRKNKAPELLSKEVNKLIHGNKLIMGMDIALRYSGVSIVDAVTEKTITSYRIRISSKDYNSELDQIFKITDYIRNIAQKYNITEASMEDGYGGINKKTALQLTKVRQSVVVGLKYIDIPTALYQPQSIKYGLVKGKRIEKDGKFIKMEVTKEMMADFIKSIDPAFEEIVGPFCDASNLSKTSDMYDATAIAIYHKRFQKL